MAVISRDVNRDRGESALGGMVPMSVLAPILMLVPRRVQVLLWVLKLVSGQIPISVKVLVVVKPVLMLVLVLVLMLVLQGLGVAVRSTLKSGPNLKLNLDSTSPKWASDCPKTNPCGVLTFFSTIGAKGSSTAFVVVTIFASIRSTCTAFKTAISLSSSGPLAGSWFPFDIDHMILVVYDTLISFAGPDGLYLLIWYFGLRSSVGRTKVCKGKDA